MRLIPLICVFSLTVSVLTLPASGAVFFSDGFEDGTATATDPISGAGWIGPSCDSGDSWAVNNNNVNSGNYSLALTFGGSIDTDDDAACEQHFDLNDEMDEVYVRFYVYFPSNYALRETPGTENTKLFYLWGNSYTEDMNKTGIEFEADLILRYKAKIVGAPNIPSCSGLTGYIDNIESYSFADNRGSWMSIEYHIRRDTGSGDGVLQLWVDGNLEINVQDVSWAGAPCGVSEFFRHGYLMGWSNSGFDEDTTVYIDDVVFSDEYIGPIDPTTPSFSGSGFTIQ